MIKYRKKPVVIEAMQVPVFSDPEDGNYFLQIGMVMGWMSVHCSTHFEMTEDKGIDIHTLEGVMHASPGDYIIRGVENEFYPCKPDIFEKTYEKV